MLIAFRVDASLEIGTGHVMRCLTLAKHMMSAGDECLFICRAFEGDLIVYLELEGMEVLSLSQQKPSEGALSISSRLAHEAWLGVGWQQDAEETLASINNRVIDCLVVDHYALDVNWELWIRDQVKNIFVIDDLADREHECFALLDQNYGREPCDYSGLLLDECEKLIGPKYALLRPEFLGLREYSLQARSKFKLKSILINLGGVDKNDFTSKIIGALASTNLDHSVNIIVVLGATNPNKLNVEQVAKDSPYDIVVKTGVSNMAELMANSDLAIGAAGSTTWERFSLGLPSILLSIAGNQDSALNALSESGCIYKLGMTTLTEDLISFFEGNVGGQLLDLSQKGMNLCDAMGVGHVEKIIRNQCEG